MLIQLSEHRWRDLVHWNPGVYIVFDKNGEIMYVGATANLGHRLQQHLVSNNMKGTLRYKVGDKCRDWYCIVRVIYDRRIRRKVERRLIERLQPVHNTNLKG